MITAVSVGVRVLVRALVGVLVGMLVGALVNSLVGLLAEAFLVGEAAVVKTRGMIKSSETDILETSESLL